MKGSDVGASRFRDGRGPTSSTWVDRIRFRIQEADRPAEVGRVLDELESLVRHFYRFANA